MSKEQKEGRNITTHDDGDVVVVTTAPVNEAKDNIIENQMLTVVKVKLAEFIEDRQPLPILRHITWLYYNGVDVRRVNFESIAANYYDLFNSDYAEADNKLCELEEKSFPVLSHQSWLEQQGVEPELFNFHVMGEASKELAETGKVDEIKKQRDAKAKK